MGLTRLFLAQKGLCFHCHGSMVWPAQYGRPHHKTMSRDHLVPRSKGGKGKSNIVLAHRLCNEKRGNKPPTQEMINRAQKLWALVNSFSAAEVERFSRERVAVPIWVRFDLPINEGEPKFDPVAWRKKHGLLKETKPAGDSQ